MVRLYLSMVMRLSLKCTLSLDWHGPREGTIILKTASSRWLAGLALAVVVLAGVSMIIALVDRRGGPSLLPEGTPEGTVHRYLLAIEKGETEAAYDYLGPEVQETCDSQHFRDSQRGFLGGGFQENQDLRVTLVDTREVEDRVEVQVRITRFRFSPPFGADEYSHGERFVLKQSGGRWAFIEPPWPMRWCPQAEKPLQPEKAR